MLCSLHSTIFTLSMVSLSSAIKSQYLTIYSVQCRARLSLPSLRFCQTLSVALTCVPWWPGLVLCPCPAGFFPSPFSSCTGMVVCHSEEKKYFCISNPHSMADG
ncbi:hypothetical protein I7I53_08957 [Histoplasma capsulatum var. duboisii H88]|uniref:Secreted protein n=1 Tax=Ajellomyces capsulatus (strain H88) TaxID=544711 RepID=A0A8A1L4F9_AJEC8|nr:hypothetical protein I7I53_08957 [Histoplasma capsulatum var. duboisii H88]